MLTNYNGQTITYDAIGNPLNYRDGMTMEWQNGRELLMCEYSSGYSTYKYGYNGLRTSKTIVGTNNRITNVKYIYEGDKLLQMTYDDYVLTFSYDANGIPVSFHVTNGYDIDTDYYYGVNSRGDVIALYNANGSLYTTYQYDAYGKLMSGAPSSAYDIANLNPLRYRSYVYDNETGLYYLQSRYYDPVTCRFINADSYISTGQDITGNNMFAYCNNNPVNYSDPAGYMKNQHYSHGPSIALPSGSGYSNGGGGGGTCGSSTPVQYIQIVRNNPYTPIVAALGTAVAFSYECARQEKADIKAREREATYSKPPNVGTTYYHSTTLDNALSINDQQEMYGSGWEGGYVYAWKLRPDKYAVKNSGAHFGVIISFKTNAAFEYDTGIDDPRIKKYIPVVSVNKGPIVVWDVNIVEVY